MNIDYRDELDDRSRRKLEVLRQPPVRSATTAARQRALYMAQVRKMPVGQTTHGLLAWWSSAIHGKADARGFTPARRKWHMPPARLLVSALEILLILFSSSFFTVYASQGSIPSDPIYPLKLLAEDVRLGLTCNEESKVDLALSLTNTRMEEIVALQEQGETVEAPVVDRMEEHYQLALQTASTMPDPQMSKALLSVQDTSHDQYNTVTTLVATAPEESEAELAQAQRMLQQNENLAIGGIKNPANFREAMRNKPDQKGAPPAPEEEPEIEPVQPPVESESQVPNSGSESKHGPDKMPQRSSPNGPAN